MVKIIPHMLETALFLCGVRMNDIPTISQAFTILASFFEAVFCTRKGSPINIVFVASCGRLTHALVDIIAIVNLTAISEGLIEPYPKLGHIVGSKSTGRIFKALLVGAVPVWVELSRTDSAIPTKTRSQFVVKMLCTYFNVGRNDELNTAEQYDNYKM
jgi:hypothetical protein